MAELVLTVDVPNLKKLFTLVALIAIVALAFYVRSAAIDADYVNGDDPFRFYRIAEYFIENHNLPANDTLSYHPDGHNFYQDHVGWYLTGGLFALAFNALGAADPALAAAHFYPPFFGALIVLLIYFLTKELFGNKKVSLLAALIFAGLPATIYRTNSSFADKEPIAGFFMLLALLFFVKSSKKFDWKYALLGGIFLTGMSATWGGIKIILTALFVYGLLMILFNKFSKEFTLTYSIAAVVHIFSATLLKSTVGVPYESLTSLFVLGNLAVVGAIVLKQLVEKYKIVSKDVLKYFGTYLIVGGTILFAATAFIYTPLGERVVEYGTLLRTPLAANPMSATVAENRPSSFNEFSAQLGNQIVPPNVPNYMQPLSSLAFFVAAPFNAFFFALLGALIVGWKLLRKSLSYELGFFLLAWFTMAAIAGIGAVRLIFLTAFPAAILAAAGLYFPARRVWQIKIKERVAKIGVNGAVVFVLVAVISTYMLTGYAFGHFSSPAYPSMTKNWEDAMVWLNNNSESSDVVLSWWDYGYVIQKVAKRPTYVDPQNKFLHRNKEVAQVFTSTNETAHLDWLKNLNIKYIVHDAAMVGKYSAVSQISSWGEHVDQLPVYKLTETACAEKDAAGNCTKQVLIYGPLWFVQTPQEVYATLVMQGGEANMSALCTPEGKLVIDPQGLPGCAFVAQDAAVLLGIRCDDQGCRTEDLTDTMFVRMWFFDAKGMEHFELVFANNEVKIFKVIY